MKNKLNNTLSVLKLLSDKNKPLSAPELIEYGVKIKRSTLYTTIDMLVDGFNGNPLVKTITYHDERTRYRYKVTEEGKKFLRSCEGP